MIYNNVFASTYKFYTKYREKNPRGSAICVLAVSQVTMFIMLFIILGKVSNINFTTLYPYRFISVAIYLVWLILLFKVYSKERADKLVSHFNGFSKTTRRLWALASLLLFILPIILTIMILIYW